MAATVINHTETSNRLSHISALAFNDEDNSIKDLLPYVIPFQEQIDEIEERAKRYIKNIRESSKLGGVEQFIQQFGLQEKEAVGLLCLAEALLRIPDTKTADALINDKLKGADWKKFLKENSGFSLHAKAWALMTSSSLANLENSNNLIAKAIHSMSEPFTRIALKAAMELLGKDFVAGQTIETALAKTKLEQKQGYSFSYDMLGEGARTEKQAKKFFANYMGALDALKDTDKDKPLFFRPNVSIKLSAIHPRYTLLQQDRVITELYDRIKQIALKAKKYNLSISIDAEESYRLDSELELFTKLILDKDLDGFDGVGFVLQAYQKRAIPIIHYLRDLAKKQNKQIPIRLVKGAYWDSEIKWSQIDGVEDYPVFTRKSHTDLSYLACSAELLQNTKYFFPQFATHNALTAAAVITLAEHLGEETSYEFQRLFGMGDAFYNQMIAKRACRIYTPVGPFKDLLPYLIRRLMENGANSNFINQLMDKKLDITKLLKNPIIKALDNLEDPHRRISLPKSIYSKRPNSMGHSLGNKKQLTDLKNQQGKYLTKIYQAPSLILGTEHRTNTTRIYSPHDQSSLVGEAHLANAQILKDALTTAISSADNWKKQDIEIRAKCLDEMAYLMKENEGELMTLLAREAGKTLADTISEIREAIDFCHYYAMQARKLSAPQENEGYTGETNHLSHHGKGIFACISPWNFPLAIYVGQIAAALVAGNSVIAKPAESTSLIAAKATELFYQAGIPNDVLLFTPAIGTLFAKEILTSPDIDGVAFTGSTATAHAINRTLAKRDAPIAKLIAETGGQNSMIVDSTALLEQAADDIIMSSFGSAGQRCSALRVLFIQDDIADELLELLTGAMAELTVNDPLLFNTDIGPVISELAQVDLKNHISSMKRKEQFIAKTPIQSPSEKSFFIEPHLFEITNINILEKEHFGPILHCIRYSANDLDKVINDINSTGYALTFGVHSRIEERIEYICKNIHAGNIYINRNITGAVVGTQPFGGMKLSGTGPKAGGPDYLKAFMNEQNISNNITVIGGNIELLN